jgi:hypothetical protein
MGLRFSYQNSLMKPVPARQSPHIQSKAVRLPRRRPEVPVEKWIAFSHDARLALHEAKAPANLAGLGDHFGGANRCITSAGPAFTVRSGSA